MKAIHANPKTIRSIFSNKYVIPNFQRPYTWDIEQCNKLWDDITDFFDEYGTSNPGNEIHEKYFLGNLVIHRHKEENTFEVIDGQQRLITLTLLIKCLHTLSRTVKALESCIKVEDPLTNEIKEQTRVRSEVLEKNQQELSDIILNNGNGLDEKKVRMKENYVNFETIVKKWHATHQDNSDTLNSLILLLLDNVVCLPIECDSTDDALVIFQTINDRGIALRDADIFKAKLYSATENSQQGDFVQRWNEIKDHDSQFRKYMHVDRAKNDSVGKEIGLRKYFDNKNRLQNNAQNVLQSIELLHKIASWNCPHDGNVLWKILDQYPNYYWQYPLNVFLHKHGTVNSHQEFELPSKCNDLFLELLGRTVQYVYMKGVVHNTVSVIKDTIFKVCAAIHHDRDYQSLYTNNAKDDRKEFKRRIEEVQYGRYRTGLVLLAAYVNKNQSIESILEFVSNRKFHVEHILPRKWNHYDKWTEDTYSAQLNTLGNLVPLEHNLNIAARNEFFDRKKEFYKSSLIADANDLVQVTNWYPEQCEQRNRESNSRLFNFFEID